MPGQSRAAGCRTGAGVLLGAVAVIAVTAACSPATPARAASHATLDPVMHIDRTLTDGPFRFHIGSVEPNIGSVHMGNIGEQADGQFVLVHVRVSNVSDAPAELEQRSQRLLDAKGHSYRSSSTADYYLNTDEVTSGPGNSALFNPIPPGGHVTGTIAFDVPRDADLTGLVLHAAPGSPGVHISLH